MEAKVNSNLKYTIILALIAAFVLPACEQEFIPEVSTLEPEYVVEGYVQAGSESPPAFLFLTRSLPFFSEIGPEELSTMFVHDAMVRVSDGEKEIEFTEICLSEIPESIRKQIAEQFGLWSDSSQIDFCIYLDLADQLVREPGRTYSLHVDTGDKILTSETTTPARVGLDTLYFTPPPDMENDTMAQLRVSIKDPAGEANFYRCFMRTNNGPFVADFSTLTDDVYFDGKAFEFQLLKPEANMDDADFNTIGLYDLGDTMTIKWCTIDEAHFNFWNTLEFSQANQGPFANYTRINGNIEGGLGIWGGYTYNLYTIFVEY